MEKLKMKGKFFYRSRGSVEPGPINFLWKQIEEETPPEGPGGHRKLPKSAPPAIPKKTTSCTPSPKPPGGVHHLLDLSAAEAYTKLLLEQSLSNVQNNLPQEPLIELTEKEGADVQEYLDTPDSETESLSSLDSLENEDLQTSKDHPLKNSFLQNVTCGQSFYLPLDTPKLHGSTSLASPQKPSYPIISRGFLEELLNKESELSLCPARDHESADDSRIHRNLTQERFHNFKDQAQSPEFQSTVICQKELTQQNLTTYSEPTTQGNDRNTQRSILKDKGSVVEPSKTLSLLDSTPLQFASLTKDFMSESKQQRTLEDKNDKHLSEMPSSLPNSSCKLRNDSLEDISRSTALLSVAYQTEWSTPNIQQTDLSPSHEHKPHVDKETEPKAEPRPPSKEEALSVDPKNETDVTKLAKAGMLKSSVSIQEHTVTHSSPNNVRFLKGILKNHLKSKSANVKFTYTPQHLLFTKEVAILIRDSVELARTKLGEPEQKRTVKKKLRWFDEVHEDEGEDRVFRGPNRRANLSQQTHKQLSRDHSEHVNLLTGVSKNISSKPSAGPQFSRQAWADVGPQKSHSQEPISQKRALGIGGPRIPRRAHSARVNSCSVTSRARKGTVIRPQSAREAQHVAKTQGKNLVPRPPPKLEVVECASPDGIQKTAALQGKLESQMIHPSLRTDTVVYVPTLSHCTCPHEMGDCSPPDALEDSARFKDNGICLDRTPTDEEITLLWNGVRSALASKDGDSHNGPLSSSPQASSSLSHVTINGKSPIRRQAMEGNMVKSRVSVENYRNQCAGTIQRKPYQIPVPTQHPIKSSHAVYSQDGTQEAVDCAQNHPSCSVPQIPKAFSHCTSTLSLEEQKILQSLQRLNQRLQDVQDTAGGNPAVRGIYALDPALNQPSESVQLSMRRKGASANNHILSTQQHS
ncbi:hypothetical protein DNTS_028603 [Danionella cerebrum]|uniref:Centrosomal protein of 126 kDa n=1 Tax=Danionella cerebrum TaxID=2873325 RepID=A0A553RI95_9TELE|nr:hypothetical protein DNTS_028603 [Danionella translucida]